MANHQEEKKVVNFLADSVVAALLKSFVAPIDRVKLLFQVQHASLQMHSCAEYNGIVRTMARVSKEQGIWSLWRGNFCNILRYVPQQALNNLFRDRYRKVLVRNPHSNWKHYAAAAAAGGAAGVTSLFFVYPLDYVRTRLAADVGRTFADREYRNIRDCFSKTFSTDGIRGLYKGFIPSIGGIAVYRAISFGTFEALKDAPGEQIDPSEAFVKSQAIIALAAIVAYPFDTVRSRMMMQANRDPELLQYNNSLDCCVKIAREEGIKGFYKGCFTNLLAGSGMTTMLVIYDAAN